MKKVLLSLLGLIIGMTLHAQQKNPSYFKLYVYNDADEVLLVKYKGAWELAGRSYDSPEGIRAVVTHMASEMGAEIDAIRLRALVPIYYNEGKQPIIFNYYSAHYREGALEVPPGCDDIRWFTVKEALQTIPFKAMTTIMEAMNEEKSYLWGGGLRVRKEKGALENTVEVVEEFYRLH